MKRLLLLGAFALAALVLGGFFAAREVAQSSNTVEISTLASFEGPSEAPGDPPHYACHMAPGMTPGVVVSLLTQFGLEEFVEVLNGEGLCAPALKNGEGDLSVPHERCFRINEPAPGYVVNLTTQFGRLENVVVGPAYYLCAPASKTTYYPPPAAPPEPHSKCYLIQGPPVNQTVNVKSQFTPAGGVPATVGAPTLLCVPAGKNGAPIPAAVHEVCYATSLPPPATNPYYVRTQFGAEEVGVGMGQLLCAPAVKEVVEPHYGCYIAPGFNPPDVVSLETRFGVEEQVEVGLGLLLCPPAVKTMPGGEPEGSLQFTHLRGFDINEPPPNKVVNLRTQFGDFDNVELGNAWWLLAPTSKEVIDPPGGGFYHRTEEPHYKCYNAYVYNVLGQATWQDQFFPQGEPVTAYHLSEVCLPAGKNGAPIPDAPDLACFVTGLPAPPYVVNLDTQFGAEQGVHIQSMQKLCVPAETEVVCIDRLGDTQCDDPVNDPDDDGCSDAEELAMGYDPTAWYDVYDVPVPAKSDLLVNGANGTRDKAVVMDDVLAVLFYVGTYDGDAGDPPNPNGVRYDTIKGVDLNGDTSNDILPPLHQIKEGVKYDRSPGALPSPPWEAGPPDGAVAMDDVLANLAQVPLDCTGPP